jgi:hypothetical protein
MATTPTTVEQQVEKTASAVWAAIGKGGTALIIAFAVTFGIWFLVHKIGEYDAALAKANADNSTFKTQLQQYQDEQQKDKALIAAAQTKTVVIEKQISTTDAKTAQTVQEVTKPDQTVQQVQKDVKTYLSYNPAIAYTNGDSNLPVLSFSVPETQQIIANKVELDGAKKDLTAKNQEIGADQTAINLQESELDAANKSLGDAKTTIDAYKKAAKKSIWKRIGGWAVDAGIAVGAYEVGKLSTK